MTVPNEHEIRDAIERYWHGRPGYGFPPAGAFSDGFSTEVVATLRAETEATLLTRLVAAGIAWAREHPDAPLRQREEVTA